MQSRQTLHKPSNDETLGDHQIRLNQFRIQDMAVLGHMHDMLSDCIELV